MGRHEKQYVTATEWAADGGGRSRSKGEEGEGSAAEFISMDSCTLTGAPCETPVADGEGNVYELPAIIKWLKEEGNGKSPVSGKAMEMSDLFRLHFQRDAKGLPICPITEQALEEGQAVAVRSVGRVYSASAMENIFGAGRRETVDPIDGVTCLTRADLVRLTRRKLRKKEAKGQEAEVKKQGAEEIKKNVAPITMTTLPAAAPLLSATSTAMPLTSKNAVRSADDELVEAVASLGDAEAMVILQTAAGDLRLNLFASECPWTCLRFIRLVKSGYFVGGECAAKVSPMLIQLSLGSMVEEAPRSERISRRERPTGCLCLGRDRLVMARQSGLAQLETLCCFGQITGGLEIILGEDLPESLAIHGVLLAEDPFEQAAKRKPEVKELEKRRREALDPTLIHKRAKAADNTVLTIGKYLKK